MRHLVPCREKTSARQLAELYIRNIVRLHGLPQSIVSDRGPQFISEFWKELCGILGINVKLSTPYHPETDGQTERLNAVMEQYLRVFINYQQDDWNRWLPLAEFAANNQASETTGVSPFFANYGFDPRIQFEPKRPAPTAPPNLRDARETAQTLSKIHDHLRTEMSRAQVRHQEYADKKRTPAPLLKVGDRVWLNAKNMDTNRPSSKLDYRRLGPFAITEVVSDWAYRLDFPRDIKVHPVQHVSLLDPASDDPFPGQIIPPPPPVEVHGEYEHRVESVLDSRIRWRRLEYLIKWEGYDSATWEKASSVNGLQAIDQFHELYPDKPGPLPEDEP